MYKENGRINVNVAGVVSTINIEDKLSYIIVDGEKVYIHSASNKLFSKIKNGEYVKLECYISNGKIFATGIS